MRNPPLGAERCMLAVRAAYLDLRARNIDVEQFQARVIEAAKLCSQQATTPAYQNIFEDEDRAILDAWRRHKEGEWVSCRDLAAIEGMPSRGKTRHGDECRIGRAMVRLLAKTPIQMKNAKNGRIYRLVPSE